MLKEVLMPKTSSEYAVYDLYQYLNIRYPDEIDLDLVAEACHIEVIRQYERSRTMTHPERRGWMLIQVDASLSDAEQRERLAHEIFHCLIHAGDQLQLPIPFVELQEAQAQAGAAHLLMPLWMLNSLYLPSNREGLIHFLADTFKVTLDFSKRRVGLIERRLMDQQIRQEIAASRIAERQVQYDWILHQDNRTLLIRRGKGIVKVFRDEYA